MPTCKFVDLIAQKKNEPAKAGEGHCPEYEIPFEANLEFTRLDHELRVRAADASSLHGRPVGTQSGDNEPPVWI